MEARVKDSSGNDVLGEFFEAQFASEKSGQIFTPFHICSFMAKLSHDASNENPENNGKTLRILDPACGSGRMLLAAHKEFGSGHMYFGIDIDRTCVQMTALNMFLHGMWNSEVMCANALLPGDFVCAYHISIFPLGIFKIEKKEESLLWHLCKEAMHKEKQPPLSDDITLDQTPFNERKKDDGTQLHLF